MISGTGLDVVEVARVARLVRDHAGRLDRIFTPAEREFCGRAPHGRDARYAAAFAGKEAVMKALGTGWRSDVQFAEIDTRAAASDGCVDLSGGAKQTADRLGVARVFLSTASTGQSALAAAFAETVTL